MAQALITNQCVIWINQCWEGVLDGRCKVIGWAWGTVISQKSGWFLMHSWLIFPAPDSVEKGSIYVNIWGQRMSIVLTNDLIKWGFLLYRKVGRSKTASVARSGNIRAKLVKQQTTHFCMVKRPWQVMASGNSMLDGQLPVFSPKSPCLMFFFAESKINVLDPTNSLWTKTHQCVICLATFGLPSGYQSYGKRWTWPIYFDIFDNDLATLW